MKNRTFTLLLLLFCLLFPLGSAYAQVCNIDSSYGSPGIYPSDTLPDMVKDSAYQAVIQFVFPIDTVIFGFTLNFDSFIVVNVPPIPGLAWDCDASQTNCHYITQPPQLTRGCVKLFGTPTQATAAYPAYDSIIVTGQAWVTVPITGPLAVTTDIPVYYRIADTIVGIEDRRPLDLGLTVHPNPASNAATIDFRLRTVADVAVEVYDLLGQRQAALPTRKLTAGKHSADLPIQGLPEGIYFVKVDLGGGRYDVVKVLKVGR